MLILTIKTDNPKTEISLYEDHNQLVHETWQADRELSQTIHTKIEALLKSHDFDWKSIDGVVCFKGPGSFTGLRIGLTVADTLSFSLGVPITGSTGQNWIEAGIDKLKDGKNEKIVVPEYGAEAHITKPKK